MGTLEPAACLGSETPPELGQRAREGLSMARGPRITDHEKAVVSQHYPTGGVAACREILGCSANRIYAVAAAVGAKRLNPGQRPPKVDADEPGARPCRFCRRLPSAHLGEVRRCPGKAGQSYVASRPAAGPITDEERETVRRVFLDLGLQGTIEHMGCGEKRVLRIAGELGLVGKLKRGPKPGRRRDWSSGAREDDLVQAPLNARSEDPAVNRFWEVWDARRAC